MAKGYSLHIGLNAVDPRHYQGWSGRLNACEADAKDMRTIALSRGFKAESLLTSKGTRRKMIDEIDSAAKKLKSGDIFLLTYSGHGGQLPDLSGDETDQQDETWCLYDGQLVDDEIYGLLGRFKGGVRVLVFSDSCHSGTVVKEAYYYGLPRSLSSDQSASQVYRFMPNDVALRVYQENKKTYDPILTDSSLQDARSRIAASVILISGCQDNQYSADGVFNGRFTGTLLRVWADGKFTGSYGRFHREIVRSMPPDQTPNYYTVGAKNEEFENQMPFTIEWYATMATQSR